MTASEKLMSRREGHLGRLAALNADLDRLGVQRTFSDAALAAMSTRGLRAAVKLTEEDLLRASKKLAEQ